MLVPVPYARPAGRRRAAFTLIELLVVMAVLTLLLAVVWTNARASLGKAKQVQCMNNLRQFAVADALYFSDNASYPAPNPYLPSSIQTQRLASLALYLNIRLPDGPLLAWPKRARQPPTLNCPRAVPSGLAEGPVMGGGLYTGYAYYAGVEESSSVTAGLVKVWHPGHAADLRRTRRGVMWADVLTEYAAADARRFEFFHHLASAKYKDFRFHAHELEGIHRSWSDGSVAWVSASMLSLTGAGSPDLQLRHTLGNFYY